MINIRSASEPASVAHVGAIFAQDGKDDGVENMKPVGVEVGGREGKGGGAAARTASYTLNQCVFPCFTPVLYSCETFTSDYIKPVYAHGTIDIAH